MKKQFFYAAFAMAMMASCTSEENFPVDPVNPTPEEDKVAIQLGIEAPSVNAEIGSRGTGSVGDVDAANNKWNNQQLYITMIDRSTGNVAMDGDTKILNWDSYTYIAPRTENPTADDLKENIRIYKNGTYSTSEADKGTIQYLYYPVNGTYDFYGWHLDGALTQTNDNPKIEANAAVAGSDNTQAQPSATKITLTGITIDGTQDIMAAKTTDRTQETIVTDNNLVDWLYSARTARNEVHPVLKFEHKLARLKFFVRAGSEATALRNAENSYAGSTEKITDDHTSTGAMYVTGIRALSMINKFNMELNNTETTTTPVDNAFETFELGDKLAATYTDNNQVLHDKVGNIDTLVAVAPEYPWKYAGKPAEYKGTPVGESIMFLPEGTSETSIQFEMDLKQYLQLTDDETSANDKWGYKTQTGAKFTVNASNVFKGGAQNTEAFKAGESYNIYITIYGFERIEVSAELTAWEDGGDVDVDIEDGTSSNPEQGTTETVTATFNISGLTEGTVASVQLNNAQGVNSTAADENGNATATITVNKGAAYTYTVTANGFENAAGVLEETETANDCNENVTMTATQQEPQTFNVTFNVTLNSQPVNDADITVSTQGCTVSGNTVTVPAGTAKITYSIEAGTNYEAVPATEVDVVAGGTINVELTEKTQGQ